MRLFIAVSPSKQVKEHLKGLILELKPRADGKVSWVSEFHLTLKFLGDVGEDDLPWLKEQLNKVKFPKFSLTLDKLGVFPNEKKINVVWIGLKDHEAVNKLQQDVEKALVGKFEKEERSFHPHITLGRVKWVNNKMDFLEAMNKSKVEALSFEADCFELIESTLTTEGAVYRVVEKFRAE